MANDTVAEGDMLIGVELVLGQLAMRHSTDGMDEVMTVKVLEPILVRIMGVRATVKVVS